MYWSRAAGRPVPTEALYAVRSRAMPAVVASASFTVAVSADPVFEIDVPSRSSDGRFGAPATFGHVASPAGSERPPVGMATLTVPPVSDGPVVSLENSMKAPFLVVSETFPSALL